MTRRRRLSDEDQALWTGFARSITPLRQSRKPAETTPSANPDIAETKPKPRATAAGAATPSRQPGRTAPPPPPLAPLDRRLRQRVARGREPIDARIDLHGKTQAEAHAALLRFLQRAQADGAKTALVVTGKGSSKRERDALAERGVLKRQVPLWLALPEFRPFVVGFDDAHVGHGGEGALYVRLRRPR
jgi:DNA-nicking Smr family endonuclease